MTTATVERMPNEVTVLRTQLENMEGQFKAALPAHIPVERFARVLMTAIQQNPELLEAERRSLWNAAMKAAQDGLLPDGREGAMVIRRDPNRGKTVTWQPMIAGIRKKARNSGEIVTWDAHVVCAGDQFQFQLGDNPQIHHSYDLKAERGSIVGAYSVAILKEGQQRSYEVMSIGEIHAIRDKTDAWKAFKAGRIKSTPWADHEGEMCRKTVARRHSKVLPMSTDLDDLIRRDDELYDMAGAREEGKALTGGRPLSLAGRLDAIASSPPSQPEEATTEAEASTAEPAAETEPTLPLDETETTPSLDTISAQGAEAYRGGVMRRAIPGEYRIPARKEEAEAWQAGWDDAKAEDDARVEG